VVPADARVTGYELRSMTGRSERQATILSEGLAAIPQRLAACERETTAMRGDVEAIRSALPSPPVAPAEAARDPECVFPCLRRVLPAVFSRVWFAPPDQSVCRLSFPVSLHPPESKFV
jgi:hypothetical protein